METGHSISFEEAKEQVTLLFTDMEGSTRLAQNYGADYDGILAQHFTVLRNAVSENEGREVVAHSDAFFAVFDRADKAVASAVTIQRQMAAAEWPAAEIVKVRLGLHTGTPIQVEDKRIGYVGIDVHRAARIADAANGGQILMSGATYSNLSEQSLPADVAVKYVGTHRLKDLQYPENLYEVTVRPGEAFPPIRSLDGRGTNLQTLPSAFIGRRRELTKLRELLRQPGVRIVTLTGPGGCGKTRLSVEATANLTDEYPDGVFQILLGSISEPQLVAPAIAQILGITEFPGHSVMDALKHAIGGKRILLVVDNFEQVIAAAPLLTELVGSCNRLKILVTSREALRISGEAVFDLAPLPLPASAQAPDDLSKNDAVMLFADRATQVDPQFVLTKEMATLVAELCRRVDGLPLAIELAASRMRLLSVKGLLDRMVLDRTGTTLTLLGRGPRDVDKRHSTLRSAIAWSYDLLQPDEQGVFNQLAVFVGTFDVAAAEHMSPHADLLDIIESLRDKNLLRTDTVEGEQRFSMLETVREFGLERLTAIGATQDLRARHAAYFVSLAERLAPGLIRADQRRSVSGLLSDTDNIRAAISWSLEQARTDVLSRLLKALLWFWIPQSRFTEGQAWLERALRAVESAGESDRVVVLDVGGWLRMISGDYAGALPLFEQASDLYERVGSNEDRTRTMMALGITTVVAKGDMQGVDKIQGALSRYQQAANAHGAGLALIALGEGARAGGDVKTAAECYAPALQAMRDHGDMYWTAALLLNAAQLHLRENDWRAASQLLNEALSVAQEFNFPMVMNLYIAAMGELALGKGRLVEAAQLFGATATLLAATGAAFEPADQAMLAESITATKLAMGEDAYRSAYDVGSKWTREEAITATIALK